MARTRLATYREPLDKFPNLQSFSAFGFGRRICPGLNHCRAIAVHPHLPYSLVGRYWAKVDANGKAVPPPSYDYVTGFNVSCNFRSAVVTSPVSTLSIGTSGVFVDMTELLLQVQPKPFDFELTPRSERQDILEKDYTAVWKHKSSVFDSLIRNELSKSSSRPQMEDGSEDGPVCLQCHVRECELFRR